MITVIEGLPDSVVGLDPWGAGGAWQDAELGLANRRSFDRIAVVTDGGSIRRLVTLAGWMFQGEVKLFPSRERENAEAWATEGLE